MSPDERIVMIYELKSTLDHYLQQRHEQGSDIAVRTLADVVRFNEKNADVVMPHFQQENLVRALARKPGERARYLHARQRSLRLAGTDGIDAELNRHGLDALIAPTTTPAWLIDWIGGDNRRGSFASPAAIAGYPHVTVPMGFVESLPSWFVVDRRPWCG